MTCRMQDMESMRAEDGITIMEKRSVGLSLTMEEGGIITDIELKMIVMTIVVGNIYFYSLSLCFESLSIISLLTASWACILKIVKF